MLLMRKCDWLKRRVTHSRILRRRIVIEARKPKQHGESRTQGYPAEPDVRPPREHQRQWNLLTQPNLKSSGPQAKSTTLSIPESKTLSRFPQFPSKTRAITLCYPVG